MLNHIFILLGVFYYVFRTYVNVYNTIRVSFIRLLVGCDLKTSPPLLSAKGAGNDADSRMLY